MFTSLHNILGNRLQHRGAIAKGVATAMAIELCQKALGEIAGEGRTTVTSLRQGTLHVQATSASVAQDLRLRRDEVVEACNRRCEQEIVKELRVTV